MKTDSLFELPPPQKTKLQLVKEQHTIYTHHTPGMGEGMDWMAVLMPPVWKLGECYGVKHGDDIPTCYSHIARLIDEGDYSGYGNTEVEAIIELCQQNKIAVIL